MRLSLPSTLVATVLFAVGAAAQTCPAPAAANAKPTWKHGLAEYNDFLAITKATADKSQQASLASAFVQKYPDSDYKNQALRIEASDQAQTSGQQAAGMTTAEQLLKSGTATNAELLAADTIIAFAGPNAVQSSDPDLAAKDALLTQAATCGQQLLSSAPAAQQAQEAPVFGKALGFAQLNEKNYDGAIATLTKVAQQAPTEALPYYWMGVAEVTKATPDYSVGIFDLAKASTLAPTATSISTYLNTVYTTYHGSTDGLQAVLDAAKTNATPPAGFKVASKVDMENAKNMADYAAQVEAQKNALPDPNTFQGIEARLKRPELSAGEWKQVKGQGYELDAIVTAVNAKGVDVAVGGTSAEATADVHLIFANPLAKLPKIGDKVTIKGVAFSFKPDPPDANTPFLLTLNQGSIDGYAFAAPKL